MNRNIFITLTLIVFIIPLVLASNPSGDEPSNWILSGLLFYFTLVNGLQDLLEVILWVVAFKEIFQVIELRRHS